jgi:Holliday junction resolvase-like predicted endonuclease
VAGYLARHGCAILARNWRANPGEVDIIALCQDTGKPGAGTLVFAEVRTRHGERGMAEQSISRRKASSMASAAYAYMAAHNLDPETTAWRIDLLAVAMRGSSIVSINWIQNALEETQL